MKITLPEGFTPPKNARPDGPFEVVATFRQSPDGAFDLIALDGVALPDEEESPPAGETPRDDASNITLPFEEEY